MKKKTIFVTLVISAMLLGAITPLVVARPPPPGTNCWVVTDDVVPMEKDEHDFYDERGGCVTDEHTQEWHYDREGDPPTSTPISDSDYFIHTTMDMWAVSSGDNAILYVKTYPTEEDPYIIPEEVRWTIINGDIGAGTFSVRVRWTPFGSFPQDENVTVYIDDPGPVEQIELGCIQDLWMGLTYYNLTFSPGQKEYWIETDYSTYSGKSYMNVTLPSDNYGGQNISEGSSHNLTWWTDKYPYNDPIYVPGWHINTKALVWVELVDTYNLKVCVRVYGESNYNPETIYWTVNYATGAPDPYFNVDIDTDGQGNDWNVNVALGDDPQFKELGSIEDPMTLDLVFYKE